MLYTNTSIETMSPYLKNRTGKMYQNQIARFRKQTGTKANLPYRLDELRLVIVCPAVMNPRCVYCRKLVITESTFNLDHIVPLIRGGQWSLSNLVLCCASCNAAKGAMTGEEFAALMEMMSQWEPYAVKDTLRRLKIGGNPMAARLVGKV